MADTENSEVKVESEEKKEEEAPKQKDENNPDNTLREVRQWHHSMSSAL